MSDYFEIDFLDVEAKKSGDAISVRYELNGNTRIHVIDGGFQETGQKLVDHINKFYARPKIIDSVIVTHPDGDHACGLLSIVEQFNVTELWMLRPWLYAEELLPRFDRFQSVENLVTRLKDVYPHIASLEEAAIKKGGITIRAPFQGESIGDFRVLAPTKARFLDMVVASEKTPEASELTEKSVGFSGVMAKAASAALAFIKAAWGVETFSSEETSAENEMSIVQCATLCGKKIVLTGDAGRAALKEASDYAPYVQFTLPGVAHFQVPHHGGRRNVSTELLDRWLGPRLPISQRPKDNGSLFSAVVSAAKDDEDHPRKAVVRAMIHRGGGVATTEGRNLRWSVNAPERNWGPAPLEEYPDEQEE